MDNNESDPRYEQPNDWPPASEEGRSPELNPENPDVPEEGAKAPEPEGER